MIAGGHDPFWAGRIKEQLRQCHIDVERLRVKGDNVELSIKN
jgi:hypothetical protein